MESSSESEYQESSESEYMSEPSSSDWDSDVPREYSLCFTDAEPVDRNIYLDEIENILTCVNKNKELCESVNIYARSIVNMVDLIKNGINSIKHLNHPTKDLYKTTKDFRQCYSDLVDELLRDQLEQIRFFIQTNK